MPETEAWIKQALTALRKLDRQQQRAQLEHMLEYLDDAQRRALRQELEARRARVQAEARTYQTRGDGDAARKIGQKEAMLARYSWLLHIMDQHVSPNDNLDDGG
ncbi:MAG: hypothetical protein M3R24_40080 [Chloroflexota bacterium]|nr:hypothetical protein [Chloroflexota bacterium]